MQRRASALRKKYSLGESLNDKQMIKFLDKNKIRAHISIDQLEEFDNEPQEIITGFNGSGRPGGLWFSVGGSWLSFLVQNEGLLNPKYKPCCFIYDIQLNEKTIFNINTIKKLNTLEKKYGNYWRPPSVLSRGYSYIKNSANYPVPIKRLMKKRNSDYFETLVEEHLLYTTPSDLNRAYQRDQGYKLTKKEIQYWKFKRWDQVAKDYSGIIFNPYFQTQRKKNFWYSSLDAPSGCVWDKSGVYDIKLLAVKPGENNKWELTEHGASF